MRNSLEIVVSAPSGAGKTTLIRNLLKINSELKFSVSTTTRERRSDETEGESYYFVSEEEFNGLIEKDEFIEWAPVHGNYYGTTKKEVDRIRNSGHIPIFDVDVQGSRSLREKMPSAVFIFIVPPSLEVLEKRLRDRKTESEESIQTRLKNAREELREYRKFDYIIINKSFDEAADSFHSIVKAEFCKRERMAAYIDSMGGIK